MPVHSVSTPLVRSDRWGFEEDKGFAGKTGVKTVFDIYSVKK